MGKTDELIAALWVHIPRGHTNVRVTPSRTPNHLMAVEGYRATSDLKSEVYLVRIVSSCNRGASGGWLVRLLVQLYPLEKKFLLITFVCLLLFVFSLSYRSHLPLTLMFFRFYLHYCSSFVFFFLSPSTNSVTKRLSFRFN